MASPREAEPARSAARCARIAFRDKCGHELQCFGYGLLFAMHGLFRRNANSFREILSYFANAESPQVEAILHFLCRRYLGG